MPNHVVRSRNHARLAQSGRARIRKTCRAEDHFIFVRKNLHATFRYGRHACSRGKQALRFLAEIAIWGPECAIGKGPRCRSKNVAQANTRADSPPP